MRRWQLFLGIELALILWLFFQIITNPMALTTILVGVFFLSSVRDGIGCARSMWLLAGFY